MKRAILAALLLGTAALLFAGPQFRLAADALTPVDRLPETAAEWNVALLPSEETLSGWHWEVILNHLGFGMHYGVRFYEGTVSPYLVDWKGDFFLSYHLFGGGSVVDPYVELGWGNVGTATIRGRDYVDYPDWEDRVNDGTAVALALYTYAAAGAAIDLNGLLLGIRVAYNPSDMSAPIPDASVGYFDLSNYELGIFAGIALGSHEHHRW